MSFQGAVELSLDAKFRLTVPTRHREALSVGGGKLVLTAHPDKCLLLYQAEVWAPKSAVIQSLNDLDPVSRKWKRLLVGYVSPVEIDGAGRILLSAELRKYAGIEKDVMLVGQGSHFELWDLAAWERELDAAADVAKSAAPPGLENFSL
jgi:MraZ protein